ncbi:MAG TPA: efflux RND transporter periplasmic adaptor subunit [Myxococcales bacterium]|jgi:HlyD family secretion protein|nr:efflux RND transporter periplasmic adaptor subunit [Myxococcales bacterium]
MTKVRWIILALAVLGVGFATVQGLRPHPPPAVEVTTSPVKRGPVTRTVTAAGHLQAVATVKVSSNISGDLLALAVKEGDRVKKGQVLGQIDKRLYESQVIQFRAAVQAARAQADQARIALEQSRRDLARVRSLVEQKLASDSDLEKADTQVKSQEGALAAAKEAVSQNDGQLGTALYNVSRATLLAPLEATVLELDHKVGERIRGSDLSEDVVLLLGGLDEMEVKAEVGEHEVVAVHDGDESTIDIDAFPDRQFHGRVSAVAKNAQIKNPGTDAEVTTFFVRVAMLDSPPGALPGMSTAVSINSATHDNVLMVPIQAVTSREAKKKEEKAPAREGSLVATSGAAAAPAPGGKPGEPPTVAATGKPKQVKVVFVLKDGKVEMREVKIGIASRTDVEILDGLAEGETVVEGPYRTLARELSDGQPAKVAKPVPGKPGGPQPPPGGRS